MPINTDPRFIGRAWITPDGPIVAGQLDLDVPIDALASGATRTFPAGGIDLRVFVRRLPARDLSRELRFEHVDPGPAHATRAYWLRATQEDGAQAWTSPVYLDPR